MKVIGAEIHPRETSPGQKTCSEASKWAGSDRESVCALVVRVINHQKCFPQPLGQDRLLSPQIYWISRGSSGLDAQITGCVLPGVTLA